MAESNGVEIAGQKKGPLLKSWAFGLRFQLQGESETTSFAPNLSAQGVFLQRVSKDLTDLFMCCLLRVSETTCIFKGIIGEC